MKKKHKERNDNENRTSNTSTNNDFIREEHWSWVNPYSLYANSVIRETYRVNHYSLWDLWSEENVISNTSSNVNVDPHLDLPPSYEEIFGDKTLPSRPSRPSRPSVFRNSYRAAVKNHCNSLQ